MSSSHSLTYPVGPIGVSKVVVEHAQQGLVWPGGGYGTVTTNWHTVFDGEGENDDPDINIPYHYDSTWMHIVFWRVAPRLAITAEAGVIKRTESITFTMTADLQAILSLPDPVPTTPSNPVETPGADVGKPITGEGGTIAEAFPPIGDTTLSNYYPTARGILSLENRLLWARAQLRQGARIAQALWTIPFERAINLSCRKSARLVWKNMPGGQIEGKITAYQITHNVETGHRGGTVTIGATPGHGGTTTPVSNPGSDYIQADYIQTGHFVNSSDVVASDSSLADFGYSVPVAETSTGEFPLKLEDVLLGINVTGSTTGQADLLASTIAQFYISPSAQRQFPQQHVNAVQEANLAIKDVIDPVKTQLTIQLVPIAGEAGFESNYPISVTPLRLPMTVNFEAPSNL
jgi:hypothetical protein